MQKTVVAIALLSLIALAGCGENSVKAANASVLSATVTVPTGTTIPAATCFTSGIALSGATSTMGITVNPAGDPQPAGLTFPLAFTGFVDAPDHVTIKVCKLAATATTTADVVLNVKAIS